MEGENYLIFLPPLHPQRSVLHVHRSICHLFFPPYCQKYLLLGRAWHCSDEETTASHIFSGSVVKRGSGVVAEWASLTNEPEGRPEIGMGTGGLHRF